MAGISEESKRKIPTPQADAGSMSNKRLLRSFTCYPVSSDGHQHEGGPKPESLCLWPTDKGQESQGKGHWVVLWAFLSKSKI